jgi:hypothetical protein
MTLPRRHLGAISGVLLTLMLSCGSYALSPAAMPKDPVPAGAGKICVVRQGTEAAGSVFPVRDNGTVVGATDSGSCFCYMAGWGHHNIEAHSDGYDLIELDIDTGKEYVILQNAQNALGTTRTRLERADPETGTAALAACTYKTLTEVPKGEVQMKPGTVVAPK